MVSTVLGSIRSWLTRGFGTPLSDTVHEATGLQELLSGQASFIAQKLVTEYCQAKAGRFWPQLSAEQAFVDALARARWEAFAAILADVVVMAEGLLRPAARQRSDLLREPLVALYARALDAYPRPRHRPEGWGDAVAALGLRLVAAQQADPLPPPLLAEVGGHRMFETMPLNLDMRRLDEPMVVNGVAFHLVALIGKLRRQLDVPAVVGSLLSPPG